MNINECEEMIRYLNLVRSSCPYELIEGMKKHECISGDNCLDCWWDKLADYIENKGDNSTKRYCTVAESLEQSLKEMKLMIEGKIPKKTWKELMEELDNE